MARERGLPEEQWLRWRAVVTVLQDVIGDQIIIGYHLPGDSNIVEVDHVQRPPRLLSEETSLPINEWTQKAIKKTIATARQVEPNRHRRELMEELDIDGEEWISAYKRAIKVFKDSKSKDFTIRYMHGVVYTNDIMNKIKPERNPSPACQLCKANLQTREHFFRRCPFILNLRKKVEDHIIRGSLTEREWALGSKKREENYIIFFFLKYVYEQSFHGNTPTLEGLEGQIAEMKVIDLEIAKKHPNRMEGHLNKWDKIDKLMILGRQTD